MRERLGMPRPRLLLFWAVVNEQIRIEFDVMESEMSYGGVRECGNEG